MDIITLRIPTPGTIIPNGVRCRFVKKSPATNAFYYFSLLPGEPSHLGLTPRVSGFLSLFAIRKPAPANAVLCITIVRRQTSYANGEYYASPESGPSCVYGRRTFGTCVPYLIRRIVCERTLSDFVRHNTRYGARQCKYKRIAFRLHGWRAAIVLRRLHYYLRTLGEQFPNSRIGFAI